jgi:dTDP-4-amino-4,6-dideoxygalactose transaminase
MLTSGTMSIAMAAHLMGIDDGDRILLPAYHCEAMVAPVTWSGASPVLYKVNRDLTVDMADVRAKLAERTQTAPIRSMGDSTACRPAPGGTMRLPV